MDKDISIIARYFLIILVGLGNLYLFYKIFFPSTFYLSYLLLSLFGETTVFPNVSIILFNQVSIEIIKACVAGSAYYLLFILAMSIPNVKISKRILLILFSFAVLLLVNSIRILLMGIVAQTIYFESLHMFFWYVLSTIFVVGIWFLSVKLFKIKEIPVYSDVKYLIEKTKHTKGKQKNNKSRK